MSSKRKLYFPMFVDLTDKKVVVVGAGTIAKRRIRTLIDFTNCLTVIAPEVNNELKELEAQGRITIIKKTYEREDIYEAAMVIAATNDKRMNQEIYTACKCLGIPVNVCNDKTRCDFYFPGIASGENLVAGISTSGRENKKARGMTEKIQALINESFQDENCTDQE